MKVNFIVPILDIEGKEIKKEDGRTAFALKDACVGALMANDEKLDGSEKMKRFLMATKIQAAKELELKIEEVVLLKEVVGKNYGTLVVGRVFEILDK